MPLNTLGSNRDQLLKIEDSKREELIAQHVLVGDSRRWRPRWFDGRFLAASDLQAEQNYFLVRQADLGRAGGSGVVDGLMVSVEANGDRVRIEPGSGVSDRGELIVLPEALLVDPANVPEIQRLDAAFGLQVIPNEPGRNRTGLYVLGLRLVEWTANPIGAYPTSLTGQRTVEDGTIVEGVAVTLIPYPDSGQEETWHRRRARVAREIFAEGKDRGFDSGVLPLALVALRGNFIEWVDPFMVRRETGAERPAGMDFGFGARALREAHLLQFQRHLADALDWNNDQPFAATEYFDALPPVGQIPAGTLDADRLTQRFFPAGIDVDLSFVPADELPALIEESLLLPPIDLTDSLEERTGTGVIVLVPLSRAEFTRNRTALPDWNAQPPQLRPAFFQIDAHTSPKNLLLARKFPTIPAKVEVPPEELAWRGFLRDALAGRLLWFVRRRHLPTPSNVPGTPVFANNPSEVDVRGLLDVVREDPQLSERVARIRDVASPEANSLLRRFSATRLLARPALLKSLLASAAGDKGAPLQPDAVLTKLAPVSDPSLGDGLAALEKEDPALGRTLRTDRVAETGVLAELDKILRQVPPEKLTEVTGELKGAAKKNNTLTAKVAELKRQFATP
ncbi:MAG: hypothetical protein WCF18_07595 [Chthoniobacteraceae bacterium]